MPRRRWPHQDVRLNIQGIFAGPSIATSNFTLLMTFLIRPLLQRRGPRTILPALIPHLGVLVLPRHAAILKSSRVDAPLQENQHHRQLEDEAGDGRHGTERTVLRPQRRNQQWNAQYHGAHPARHHPLDRYVRHTLPPHQAVDHPHDDQTNCPQEQKPADKAPDSPISQVCVETKRKKDRGREQNVEDHLVDGVDVPLASA
mmetsp:Transcript_10007/g.27206  ORF Transcript_10007/g.27206 Transcript_10007/m.27206 type:complete len:201 (+) Transcript_10007:712-1314(+)